MTKRGPTKLTARLVEKYREQFEAGEGAALLNAIDLCARSGLLLPLWAAQAFCDRFLDWASLRAPTLDVAFQVERRKQTHQAIRNRVRPSVVLRVLKLQQEGEPTDQRLFDRVGADLNISGALAKSIFYDNTSKLWRQKILRNARIS